MLVTHPRQIKINITTYEAKVKKLIDRKMDQHTHKRTDGKHKFVCSVCLNTRINENKVEGLKSKSCPLCDRRENKYHDHHVATKLINESDTRVMYSSKGARPKDDTKEAVPEANNRKEISLGLNLLNEVLSVFQNNKKLDITNSTERKNDLIDVAVGTECNGCDCKLKLGISKMLQLSIVEGNNFKDSSSSSYSVNAVYPENSKRSFMALPKHKSASIPQMKLEELKNALQQRSKSKDTIEEVNRMFATVKKLEKDDDGNRPMIRNGPRVLPVVKTYQPAFKETEELHRATTFNDKDVKECMRNACLYCRHANESQLCSGDSNKHKVCMTRGSRKESSCCQKKVICECCQNHCNLQQFVCCSHCEPNSTS